MSKKRWTIIGAGVLAVAVGGVFLTSQAKPASAALAVTVYKSPTCGCCTKWGEYMRSLGHDVEAHDVRQMADVKAELGVPSMLQSCHTAIIDGYVIEGHVPADVIQRLLLERPPVAGLAVPGMPVGSPGMEGPRRDRYNIVAFDRTGGTSVYAQRGF